MQSKNQASAPTEDFDKAIASLRDLVATAHRDSQNTSDSDQPQNQASQAAPEDAGAQAGGFGGFGAYGTAPQEPRSEAYSSPQARQPRLTDVLASGIHEVTQNVGELIDANRAAHAHLFGPLSLPPRPGGTRPASSATADGQLAGAMWQLREAIKELQAVSSALLTRI